MHATGNGGVRISRPPARARLPSAPSALNRALYNQVQRLNHDVQTIVPIHGGRTFPWGRRTYVMGIINAASDNVPVVMMSGTTPL